MHLRSRVVGGTEAEEAASVSAAVSASASSTSMDDESYSTEAVWGSPLTRRSWSTHESQNPTQSPAPEPPLTPSPMQARLPEQLRHQSEPGPSRVAYTHFPPYDDGVVTPRHSDYPKELDSQELYIASQPETQNAEDPVPHNQPPPSSPIYSTSNIPSNLRTPIQVHPTEHPNPYVTPHSQNRYHNRSDPQAGQTPLPPTTYQSNDYGRPSHPPTPASVPLTRYARGVDESWSSAIPTDPVVHKRRISEADETLQYRDKLRTELDEMEEGDDGGGERRDRRKRRRIGKGKGKGKPRSKSRDRGGDNDKGGPRGGEQGMTAA